MFLLTGLAAGLACDYLVRRDGRAVFRLIPVCAAWGVGFAVTYQVSLRTIDLDGFLKIFWAQRFLSVSDWHHSYALVASAFIVPLDLATVHPWPLIPVCALGLWAIFARREALGLFLAVPVVALAIASLFQMYPFWHRMILFVLPLLLLPTCEGVIVIVERARWVWKPLGAAVAVALVALLSVRTVEHLIVGPTPFLEIRPMLRHVREHTRPGDVMYIGEFQPVYEYYKDRLGLAAQPYVVGRYLDKEWAGSDDQVLESLRDSPRVWALTGDWQVQAGLERFATLVEIMPNEDLTLSLYDPQAQPRTLPPDATVSSGR